MLDVFNIVHHYWTLFLIGSYPNGPLGGVAATLTLSLFTMIIAFPVGIALAIGRLSPLKPIRRIAIIWIYALRSIPLIMLVFWTYFLVPLLIGRSISGYLIMLCTLVLYESAYIAEIIRGAMKALPYGQYEGARALGLGYFRTYILVILPQALYNSIPSLVSQFVSIIKDTTLGYIINVQELTFAADQVNNQLLVKPFQVFFIVAFIYYVICFGLTQLANWLERRITRKRSGLMLVAAATQL